MSRRLGPRRSVKLLRVLESGIGRCRPPTEPVAAFTDCLGSAIKLRPPKLHPPIHPSRTGEDADRNRDHRKAPAIRVQGGGTGVLKPARLRGGLFDKRPDAGMRGTAHAVFDASAT